MCDELLITSVPAETLQNLVWKNRKPGGFLKSKFRLHNTNSIQFLPIFAAIYGTNFNNKIGVVILANQV